jgi:hypothetical protein
MNPNIFSTAKRWMPHWTLAVKTQVRKNPFAHPAPDEPGAAECMVLSRKGKREVAMSESLYVGQKQLGVFT